MNRQPRPKKCAWCGKPFTPKRIGQKCGSVSCSLAHTRAQAAREAHRAPRKPGAGKAPTDRRTALKRCQIAFNAFIRERDKHQPCITCGTYNPGGDPRGGVWDCGHYLTTGAHPEKRFMPDNAARQCVSCNRHRSGAQKEYREALIRRIGLARVEAVEAPEPPAKWTVDDLNRMAADFRRRVREMKKEAA